MRAFALIGAGSLDVSVVEGRLWQICQCHHKQHGLFREAHSQAKNANFAKAAQIAEVEGTPRDTRQLENHVVIQNLRTAIDGGASAAGPMSLLLHAIEVAEHWTRSSK